MTLCPAWSRADLAFRDEARAFLAEHLTDELRASGRRKTSVYADHDASMAWQRILYAKGWVAPAWPTSYGGAGWSVLQPCIWTRERVAAGAPPTSPMGIGMCGPALIGFGSQAQKAHFLPRMLSGEDLWCQGYSEADAGSDLAALQMAAEDDGDDFICSGRSFGPPTRTWRTGASVWCVPAAKTGRRKGSPSF